MLDAKEKEERGSPTAKWFLSDRSNMSAWEAVVCTMSLELINHSSFHIQEEGKNLHSNLGAAVSLHSVPHRKSAKERKALWGQEGKLTSEAGYETKSLSLRNATSGTCVVPLFLKGYIETLGQP